MDTQITFNLLQIIEENKESGERFIYPTKDTFKGIEDFFHITIDGIYYEVSVEKKENYIWFSYDFGKPNPRDENLTNINTGEKRENDRKTEEAELLNQFFCLYYYTTNILYISNIKKQKSFEFTLKEKTNTKFLFNTFKKTKDEFISILKDVNKIKFTEAHHLFSHDSKKRNALKDLTGIDSPKEFTIEVAYPKSNLLADYINVLFNEKSNGCLKDLIITGQDEDNFEIVFNNETFLKRIELKVSKDNNGKFISSDVKDKLVVEISKI